MKTGNVTGAVYKRSVHRKLKNEKEWIRGAAHGEDCAFFEWGNRTEGMVLAQGSVYTGADTAAYAVYSAVNRAAQNAAARGAGQAAAGKAELGRCAVQVQILLPAQEREQVLQRMVLDVQTAADRMGAGLADVKACVTPAVSVPVTSASAVLAPGEMAEESAAAGENQNISFAGAQIVMTKWAGLEGTARLTNRCREQLLTRYPAQFLAEAAEFDRQLSILPEAAVACKSGVGAVCAAGEGGVFHALWTLAEQTGTGLEVFLKKIPIRQETVEVCNLLDVNPYELASNGSLLCVTKQGEALAENFRRAGICAEVIGLMTGENDRVILNGQERRFLEPAKEDSIYRVLPV